MNTNRKERKKIVTLPQIGLEGKNYDFLCCCLKARLSREGLGCNKARGKTEPSEGSLMETMEHPISGFVFWA